MEQSFDGETLGLAWVEQGLIKVKDPSPGSRPATIKPTHGVEVVISGNVVDGEAQVFESSEITVIPLNKDPVYSYKIQIANDGLEAYLILDVTDGVYYELKDSPPSNYLRLEVESHVVPAELDPKGIIESAKKMGIEFGLDVEACVRACEEKPTEPVLIAKGRPSVPGKDGKIEFVVPLEKVIDLPIDELQVDFRESVRIPDVKAGEVIAVKTLPVTGVPGMTVTGKPIPPAKPKDPPFRAGKGVRLHEEEGITFAIATISGCPKYSESSGIIEVDEIFFHRGDVDLSSGNIKASGGVHITGNVAEGTKVECESTLEIGGTVTGAQLKSWGTIKILGNVFKSEISAGKDVQWVQKWNTMLESVEERIDTILEIERQASRLIEEFGVEVSAEQVRRLCDPGVLFDYFRELIMVLADFYKEDLSTLPEEVRDGILRTRDKLTDGSGTVFERTRAVSGDLAIVRTWVDSEILAGQSDVIVPYIQNSTVNASRDVVVTGQGVLYSDISAGRAVKVQGSPGLVRGSKVYATELIQVNAAGSQGSAATILRVSETGTIIAGTVYPNTSFVFGRTRIRTENAMHSVKASIRKDKLIIQSSTGTIEVDV